MAMWMVTDCHWTLWPTQRWPKHRVVYCASAVPYRLASCVFKHSGTYLIKGCWLVEVL